MNNTDLTVFYVLKKQLGGEVMLNDDMERHIRLKFMQVNNDYTIKPEDGPTWAVPFEVPARNCREEDFTRDPERNKKIVSDWKGYSLLCPDLDYSKGQGFNVEGDASTM